MTVPYAFANLSGNIALAKLDSNFNTPITIGNTSVLLGNTVTTLNNLTLSNVTITSATGANISLTSPLAVSSGGTGVANLTVNNVLIGNGTNAIASVAPGTTGNVLTSIGGAWVSNVALTSAAAGANTQVQYNNSGALAGSANLTFNGTTLTANTLNLTNALGTTYGGTGLTSFTANGVVYASSSSVLATGSALTFDGTTLGVSSGSSTPALKLYGAGSTQGQLQFGSAAGYVIQGGPDYTGLVYNVGSASYQHIFQINSSEQMRLTSTGLGIGTSSPATKLHVNTAAAGYGITIAASSQTSITYQLGIDSNSNLAVYDTNAAAQRLVLSSSGNLGIGTTSPSASAILDAQSTTKGVRMPNMTTTQKNAISSPAAGLMVFDTTLAKLCVYSGSAWQTITSV